MFGRWFLLALVALVGVLPSPAQDRGDKRSGGALVIPVSGVVSFRTVALVRRGLAEAGSRGAARVIVEIDTPGGWIDSMEEVVTLLNLLHEQNVDTVAYVKNQALSAGAVIALACRRIYMAQGATIGAATPVFAGGLGSTIPDEERRKYVSAFRADVRAIAEHHGPDVALLAEAMVDPEVVLVRVSYRDKDGLLRKQLMPEQELDGLRRQAGVTVLEEKPLTSRPLTVTASEALELGLVEGLADSLDDLLRELGVGERDYERLEPTWSEELASFLHGIRIFLLIAGVVLAVVAVKTPGTGVPEALALLCFALFFAGSWMVGLAALTEILLFVGGLGLILIEIFVIPGTLVAGIAGFLMFVAALFLSLQPFVIPSNQMEGDVMRGNLMDLLIVVVGVTGLSILLSRLLPHVPWFNRLLLDVRHDRRVFETAATSEEALSPLVGRRGQTLTDLRPAGKMEVDGEPIDVVTSGGYIERGTWAEIVKVEGNRVVVQAAEESQRGEVAIAWLVFMVFLGLLAMVAEVFFPSFGVLSVVSAVLTVTAVFLAFGHGTAVGVTFLVVVAITAPIVVFFAFRTLPKTGIGKRLILAGPTFLPDRRSVRDADLESFIGRQGIAINTLRPSGTIEVDGRRLDAVTRGEGIEAGSAVRVLAVELAQLVVTRVGAETTA